jgi:hypothetical protein
MNYALYLIASFVIRYTDMYSDIMTAEPNTDELAELEERTAADDAKALQVIEYRSWEEENHNTQHALDYFVSKTFSKI